MQTTYQTRWTELAATRTLLYAAALLLPAVLLPGMAQADAPATAPPARVAVGEAAVDASLVMGKADGLVLQMLSAPAAPGWTSVIVKTDGPLTAAREAQLTALHADIYRHLSIIQSVAVRIPSRSLNRLAALPFVMHISSDMQVKKTDASAAPKGER